MAHGQLRLNDIFNALAHEKRRAILHELSFRPATINQLATEHALSLPLIQRRKSGRTNFIALNKKTLKLTQEWLLQYNTAWGNDQETLENYIASLKASQ
jgi:hypothetical protein